MTVLGSRCFDISLSNIYHRVQDWSSPRWHCFDVLEFPIPYSKDLQHGRFLSILLSTHQLVHTISYTGDSINDPTFKLISNVILKQVSTWPKASRQRKLFLSQNLFLDTLRDITGTKHGRSYDSHQTRHTETPRTLRCVTEVIIQENYSLYIDI